MKKYKASIIEFMIRSYFVGAAVYIGVFMLNQSFIEVALIIGLITHFMTEPIIHHFYKGNKEQENGRMGILKQIGIAYLLVTIIYICQLQIPSNFKFSLEPFSFSIIYQSLWMVMKVMMNLLHNSGRAVQN